MQSHGWRHSAWIPYLYGFLGVAIFSLSFPATKLAVRELDPWFVVSARTLIAGVLGLLWLLFRRPAWRAHWRELRTPLFWQIFGAVLAFPLLSAIALRTTGSSHGALVIAIIPILTAVVASVLFGRQRSVWFWLCALGASGVVAFTVLQHSSITLQREDMLLLVASALVAVGYAYGGRATALVGGATSISLAVAAVVPLALAGVVVFWPAAVPSLASLFGVAYLGAFSMFVGFIFWYEGLGRGPMEQIGLLQSFQIFLTLLAGHFAFGEALGWNEMLPSVLIAGLIGVSKRV